MSEASESIAKMGNATKWSFITEIGTKFISPVTNAILARILVPEAFGLVATINMVVSFTDIFTDAGFQKFIIQHEFDNENEKEKCINVAFWSNLVLSLFLLLILILFRDLIADFTGSPGLGNGIAVAALNLPVTSFSSIQQSVFKRKLDFKALFFFRMASALVPLLITVPIAFVTKSYWALVIGTLVGNTVGASILTAMSSWRPKRYYDGAIFRKMFSFCYWILIESVMIWVTNYIGIFIVGRYISAYYLGLYKTSMTTINQISSIVTTAVSPIVFSVTSRLQNDRNTMYKLFLNSLRLISMILTPMGFGIWLYRDCITGIMLGSQWTEAIDFIGLWGICNAFGLVLSSFWDGMFNAIGEPKYSVLTQFLYLLFLVPMLLYGAMNGYDLLYHLRCLSKIIYIFIQLTAVKIIFKIGYKKSMGVIVPATICSIPMVLAGLIMKYVSTNLFIEIVEIIICIMIYLVTVVAIPYTRRDLINILVAMKIKVPARIMESVKVGKNVR